MGGWLDHYFLLSVLPLGAFHLSQEVVLTLKVLLYSLLQQAMTTCTSTAAYSLMSCRNGEAPQFNITPSISQARSTDRLPLGGVRTCLMALAPTESTKQTDVQSKMTEWTAPAGSGTRASSGRSSNRPFRCSSSAVTSVRTAWVTPSLLN